MGYSAFSRPTRAGHHRRRRGAAREQEADHRRRARGPPGRREGGLRALAPLPCAPVPSPL